MTISEIRERLKVLATGRCEWVDVDTGQVEVDQMGWRDRWAVFGPHSYEWRWVRRLGAMECGCTLNPLTRNIVLYRWECDTHCGLDPSDAALLERDS